MYLILLVSQKGFLSGNTQASSETQNIPDADFQVSQTVRTQRPSICRQPESLGHACARCSVKSGLGEAETTLFSAPRGARVAGWVRGGGSTVHLRVPAAGSGAAGSRSLREPRGEGAPQVASGRSPLPLGRAGGKARRAEGERLHGRRGSRRSIPRPGTAPGAAAPLPQPRPGPPPTARGGRHPAGGDLREPARAAPPAPGRASFPARARLARGWTGNPAGNARPAGACGEEARTPTPRPGAGFKGEPPRLPAFAIQSLLPRPPLPPACHYLLGDHQAVIEVGCKLGFPDVIEELQKRRAHEGPSSFFSGARSGYLH